jgi:hypothetical protein
LAKQFPLRLVSVSIFRTAESRTLMVEGDRDSIPAFHSIRRARERGRLAQNWEQIIQGFGVVATLHLNPGFAIG